MSHFPLLHYTRALLVGSILCSTLLFVGCDVPTEGPSLRARPSLEAPLIVDKTFVFLGDDQPPEALVDTTTTAFDSLFAVDPDGQISLDREINDFNIGSPERAFTSVEERIRADADVDLSIVEESDLFEQSVRGQYVQENDIFESPAAEQSPVPVPPSNSAAVTVPFPDAVLAAPDFGVIDARNATVDRVTLTPQTSVEGTVVNQMTLTLTNDLQNTSLTDGDGGPPRILLERTDGSVTAGATFDAVIPPNSSASVVLRLAGRIVDTGGQFRITIDGPQASQPEEVTLTVETAQLRYQEAVLSSTDAIDIDITDELISLDGETRFLGIRAQGGSVTTEIISQFDFPIAITGLTSVNELESFPQLPDDFRTIAFEGADRTVGANDVATVTDDIGTTDVAREVTSSFDAEIVGNPETITVRADGRVEVDIDATARIQSLFFRPDGEDLRIQDVVSVDADAVRFETENDFYDIETGRLSLSDFESTLDVAFDTLDFSFRSIRQPPFDPRDSLVVRFADPADPDDPFRSGSVGRNDSPRSLEFPLDNLRVLPLGNEVEYLAQAVLPRLENVRRLDADDRLTGFFSFGDFSVQDVAARLVEPISFEVTPDADDDGVIDIMDPSESEVSTFADEADVGTNIDTLPIEGTTFTLRFTTDISGDATLVGALLGRTADGDEVYLAGRADRAVAPADSLVGRFVADGTPIAADNLIQLDIEGAPIGETAERTIELSPSNSTIDAFTAALPEEVRFVGIALLNGDQRVQLSSPLRLDAALDLSVPLRLREDFVYRDTIEVDLTELEEITDDTEDASVTSAALQVDYENGIPLGATATIDVLDATGATLLTFPNDDDSPIRIVPAAVDADGRPTEARASGVSIPLSNSELQTLTRGTAIRLQLDFETDGDQSASLRANDELRFSVRADVDTAVDISSE